MDKFLERQELLKLTFKKIGILNWPINEELKLIIFKFSTTKKSPDPDGLIGEF